MYLTSLLTPSMNPWLWLGQDLSCIIFTSGHIRWSSVNIEYKNSWPLYHYSYNNIIYLYIYCIIRTPSVVFILIKWYACLQHAYF